MIKLNFTLGEAIKALRESTGTLYSFFNLSARWGGGQVPGLFWMVEQYVQLINLCKHIFTIICLMRHLKL
jgi:hypothetical protein